MEEQYIIHIYRRIRRQRNTSSPRHRLSPLSFVLSPRHHALIANRSACLYGNTRRHQFTAGSIAMQTKKSAFLRARATAHMLRFSANRTRYMILPEGCPADGVTRDERYPQWLAGVAHADDSVVRSTAPGT